MICRAQRLPEEFKHSPLNWTGTFQHSYTHSSIQHTPSSRRPSFSSPLLSPQLSLLKTSTEMSPIQQLHYRHFPHKLLPFIPLTHSSSPATHALPYLASPVRVSTPPPRLVRAVRKQLMELSSAKTHRHLLYPLCDDSGDRYPPTHTHTDNESPFSNDSWGKSGERIIWSSNPNICGRQL